MELSQRTHNKTKHAQTESPEPLTAEEQQIPESVFGAPHLGCSPQFGADVQVGVVSVSHLKHR